MKLTFIAFLVVATQVNGQDYFDNVDKRGGDARFATGVMGAGFNRISKNQGSTDRQWIGPGPWIPGRHTSPKSQSKSMISQATLFNSPTLLCG